MLGISFITAAAAAASETGDVVGKVTVGYQGWFSAPGDGSPVNAWGHDNLEMWPDIREYSNTYPTTPCPVQWRTGATVQLLR